MSETLPVAKGRRLNRTARIGAAVLAGMFALCVLTLPWTLWQQGDERTQYFDKQYHDIHHAPPQWGIPDPTEPPSDGQPLPPEDRYESSPPSFAHAWLGTDNLGRSVLARCLLGGAISLGIGIAAAMISVLIGTLWGLVSGNSGGRTDAFMMRTVDVLYGLPYILLVLLLVVAVDGSIDRFKSSFNETMQPPGSPTTRGSEESASLRAARLANEPKIRAYNEAMTRVGEAREAAAALPEGESKQAKRVQADELERRAEQLDPRPAALRFLEENLWVVNIGSLLVAIGAVSWLTLARVVRGQVLSLRNQPFVEAARAMGCSTSRILFRHLLPNLMGPIIVYTTLTVPQAILQESFLSFLGIGVKPPLPSWGNLAAEGLKELNPVQSYWWLLAWPCLLLALTLLSLNFLGDGLRDKYDPRSQK